MQLNPSISELRKLYLENELSAPEIAERFNLKPWTVWSYLKKNAVPIRNVKEASRVAQKNRRWEKLGELDNNTQRKIFELYILKQRSGSQIGKLLGISESTVYKYLKKEKIPTRSHKKALPEGLLRKLYNEQHLTVCEIAEKLGKSPSTISAYLRAIGISRSQLESRKIRGTCFPKGGRYVADGYAYIKCPNHPQVKKSGYIAEHILVWEKYYNRPLPEGYVVHHLNGIKGDNRPENLVAMPRGKHTQVHLGEPYKKRIRQLEIENRQLRRALEDSQMIFTFNEN